MRSAAGFFEYTIGASPRHNEAKDDAIFTRLKGGKSITRTIECHLAHTFRTALNVVDAVDKNLRIVVGVDVDGSRSCQSLFFCFFSKFQDSLLSFRWSLRLTKQTWAAQVPKDFFPQITSAQALLP